MKIRSIDIQAFALYRFCSICLHRKKIKQAIAEYRPELKGGSRLLLELKLVWLYTSKMWLPEEYFIIDYEHLSQKERREFVPNNEYFLFMKSFVRQEARDITDDKWKSYQFMAEYYKRKAFLLPAPSGANIDDIEAGLRNFLVSCGGVTQDFIIKPLSLACGIGVKRLTIESSFGKDFVSSLMSEYPDGAIIEELIRQSSGLGQYHPQSINTVRINTLKTNDGVQIFLPYLRIGRRGKIIDNTNNGGILSSIDLQTGLLSAAMDVYYNVFAVHPDSGCNIEGNQIPRWEEAKQLAIEMANKFPYTRLVGWDLALTDDGWVLVELNSQPGIAIVQRHFRNEFERLKQLK